MKELIEKYLANTKRKRIKTREIEDYLLKNLARQEYSYQKFVEAIKELIAEDKIKAVKARGKNARLPTLYNCYQTKNKTQELADKLKNKLLAFYHPKISLSYYLKQKDKYEADKDYLKQLDSFLKNNQTQVNIPVHERSFQIFNNEKFLTSSLGKKMLKRCKLKLSDLNCYLTSEPFFYYRRRNNSSEKNILILENKDTFYSLKQLMRDNIFTWGRISFSLLIYGEGKKIQKSFAFFFELDDYQNQDYQLNFYYFGDLDPSGIFIWWKLNQEYEIEFKPCLPFYQKLIELYAAKAPVLSKQQRFNQIAIKEFIAYFSSASQEKITELLKQENYIPQEGLNYQILKDSCWRLNK